jgi:hypothetical protein
MNFLSIRGKIILAFSVGILLFILVSTFLQFSSRAALNRSLYLSYVFEISQLIKRLQSVVVEAVQFQNEIIIQETGGEVVEKINENLEKLKELKGIESEIDKLNDAVFEYFTISGKIIRGEGDLEDLSNPLIF